MAHIRRRKGGWQCIVRVQGYPPITKTFNTKIDAQRYSRDLENKLFREKHNIAKKKFPLMRDALIRYRDEVVVHKRSKDMETKLIGYILSEGFVNYAVNLIDRSLIAQYRDRASQKNKKILPKKDNKDDMSLWDMMKESARMDAKKGDHSGMRQIKKTLHDDYKRSGGKWMSDEEKKMIGKHTLPEPIKLNLEPITKGRLLLEEMEADNKRLEEQRKKIFEKKQSDENIGGLAYLLNTNK